MRMATVVRFGEALELDISVLFSDIAVPGHPAER